MSEKTDNNNKELQVGAEPIKITDLASVVKFATTLKKFVVEQGLYIKLGEKNYALVEAWQFAGGAMGILPEVTSLIRIIDDTVADGEIRYRAEIELRNLNTEKVVGTGIAICSSLEGGRGKQSEYVIASMAQTRAIGKAYRNMIGWLLKLAGYEPTAAEEATGAVSAGLDEEVPAKIAKAKSREELDQILGSLNADEKRTAAPLISARLKELTPKSASQNAPVKEAPDAAA